MTRALKLISRGVSWIFFIAGALVFAHGRVLFLVLPARSGIPETFWSGMVISFTVAPILVLLGLPFRAWSQRS